MSEHNIILRKISEKDTPNIVKWRNSDTVRRNLYTQSVLTEQQHINWLKTKVETGLCAQYIIVSVDDNADIGTVFIKNIDIKNKKGEFGIFIGESFGRGKGYAKTAASKMLNIAFNELNLNRVYLTVMSDNIAAIKSYKHAGFAEEGILKEDFFRNGEYIDIVLMGITKKMWSERTASFSDLP